MDALLKQLTLTLCVAICFIAIVDGQKGNKPDNGNGNGNGNVNTPQPVTPIECYECGSENPDCNVTTTCTSSCYTIHQQNIGGSNGRVTQRGCWGKGQCQSNSVEEDGLNITTVCCSENSCNWHFAGTLTTTAAPEIPTEGVIDDTIDEFPAWMLVYNNWYAQQGGSGTGTNNGDNEEQANRCYECHSDTGNCPEDGSTLDSSSGNTRECDGFCYTQIEGLLGLDTFNTISRGCLSTCESGKSSTPLAEVTIECCQGDLCNAGNFVRIGAALMMLCYIFGQFYTKGLNVEF